MIEPTETYSVLPCTCSAAEHYEADKELDLCDIYRDQTNFAPSKSLARYRYCGLNLMYLSCLISLLIVSTLPRASRWRLFHEVPSQYSHNQLNIAIQGPSTLVIPVIPRRTVSLLSFYSDITLSASLYIINQIGRLGRRNSLETPLVVTAWPIQSTRGDLLRIDRNRKNVVDQAR